MDTGASGRLRAALLLLAIASAGAAAGTLKVAACETYWPYVGVSEGAQLTGFDVEFWELLYPEMRNIALQKADAEVLAMLGDSAPAITVVPRAKLIADLQAGTIDVGLCGLQVNSENHRMFDQTPGVISAGFRALIKYEKPDLDGMSVLRGAFVGLNASAVFSLLLLLVLSVINAHVIFLLERHDNVHVSKVYGWGVFDAWWLSLVTALTVGYGDKVPVTFGGRLTMLVWMFIGTYCMGIFSAAVTSDFLAPNKETIRHGLASITRISELKPSTKVGTADPSAREQVASAVKGIAVTQFSDTRTLLKALTDGMIDIAVDDEWHTRWLIENDAEFKDWNLLPVGAVIGARPRAFGVSRRQLVEGSASQNYSHPILRVLNPAVVHFAFDAGQGRFQSISSAWMLDYEPLLTVTYAEALSEALNYWNTVYGIGLSGFIMLWGMFVYIHYRKLIADRRVREGMLLAMGLDHKFSQRELRDAALKFFHEVDTDGSETVDASELVEKLQQKGMVLQPEDLDMIFDEGVAADYTFAGDDLALNASSMKNIFASSSTRRKDRHLDVKQFQTVVLKLAMGTQSEQNTELTAPVLQVHLEQAMLELKDHLHYIERKINQVTLKGEKRRHPASEHVVSPPVDAFEARLGAELERDGARTPSPATLKTDASTIRKPYENGQDSQRKEYAGRLGSNESRTSRREASPFSPDYAASPAGWGPQHRHSFRPGDSSGHRLDLDKRVYQRAESEAFYDNDSHLVHPNDWPSGIVQRKSDRREWRPISALPPRRRETSGNPGYEAAGADHPFAPAYDYVPHEHMGHRHPIPRYQPPQVQKR